MALPRPTLADIDLPPRRRLRDGTRSTASSSSSSSRSSSVASSHRGRSGRGRGRSVSTFSTLSSSGSEVMPTRTTRSRRGVSTARTPAPASAVRRSPRSRHQATLDDATQGAGPIWDPPTRSYDHGATLLDMLDVIDGTNTRQQPGQNIDTAAGVASSSSSSSSSSPTHPAPVHTPGGRRYTAAEKGKGRAPPAETITISDNEEGDDEAIVVTGVKRKVHELEDEDEDEVIVDDALDGGAVVSGEDGVAVDVEEQEEQGDKLGEFTCPVCFSEPTQAVMTVCGHVLCAECLHSSLLAAIARNPNPYPHNQPPPPRPKARSRRGAGTGAKKSAQPQPTSWTIHTLREAWSHYRDVEYTKNARAAGMDQASIEAGREPTPDADALSITMVLKGLWKVEERYWVIEGECPVCRKGLPGGYGPPGTGIGGVIPLRVRVGGGAGGVGGAKR